jgi:hypothetical protein
MRQATVLHYCETCKELTARKTFGIERPPGKEAFQRVECLKCGTTTKIYLGPNGDQYQKNADMPDDLEKDS